MNSKNDYIREYLGVDKFHAKGYTGKRVHALTGERLDEWMTQHSQQTAAAFHEIAPDAEVTYAPFPGAKNVVEKFHDLRGDACVMFVSLSMEGSSGKEIADEAIPDGLFVCVAAGNFDEDYANGMILPASAYGVGAVDIRWSALRGGKPLPGANLLVHSAEYTSHSDHVDFGAAAGLYLPGSIDAFPGTSCSAPVLAGMAALVNDFFMDKTGRPLPHLSMYRFMKDHAVDIEEKGKDEKSGWGVPRLPDPDTIDIWKYQVPEENEKTEEDDTMKILLIAGHGAGDPGATAKICGKTYKEADETRALVGLLADELRKYKVGMEVYDTTKNAYSNLQSNQLKLPAADYVLEIHFNAFKADAGDGKTKGVECYVTKAEKSTKVEETICKAVAALGFTNRGVKRQDYAVIKAAKAAGASSALLETCFLDDADDMALYTKNREKVAQVIAAAVAEGFKLEKLPTKTTLYRVQVGAFAVKANAERMKKELEDKGYQAFIVQA